MKKIKLLIVALLFMSGCNIFNGETKKDVYEIGDTAEIHNKDNEYSYKVTLNDVSVTKKIEVEGYNPVHIDDYYEGSDDARFIVANVTFENIGEEKFIPIPSHKPILKGNVLLYEEALIDFPNTFSNSVDIGEELTDDFFFATEDLYEEDDMVSLYFHIDNEDEKVEFQIPADDLK